MKYLFILGRNIQLSSAEVFSYLKRTGNKILNFNLNKNALLAEVEKTIDAGAVEFLGGVISIGVVLASGSIKEIIKNLDEKEIYLGESNKLNYSVWNFSENTDEIREYLKSRFKQEKIKATEKNFVKNMRFQGEAEYEIFGSKNIDEQYFVFDSDKIYFGKIIQKCDYSEIEKRDMQKPVRREELAISPRIAKIMINLSEIQEGEKLLDCFCGIGVILQEALLQNFDAIGIDKDKEAIQGAEKNMKWFKFSEDKYKLFNEDSVKIELENPADVLVSEPNLGLILKKIPNEKQAKIQLRNFEELIIKVLNNLKTKIRGKIVLSSPLVKTFSKRIGCNIEKILEKTGLKLAKNFPIDEFRENQIVGRRIFVFEK